MQCSVLKELVVSSWFCDLMPTGISVGIGKMHHSGVEVQPKLSARFLTMKSALLS